MQFIENTILINALKMHTKVTNEYTKIPAFNFLTLLNIILIL